MRHNRLRALLTADQPSLGTHLLSSWPTLVELVGDAGNYDYVEFTAEYAPFHMHDLDNLGRALELKSLGGMRDSSPVRRQREIRTALDTV